MSEKIKEVAVEEAERVKGLVREAASSNAYLYPFKGITYFMSHKSLWGPLLSKLAPTLSLGIGVTTFMFFFTYIPQAALLALFNGPLAFISTALLVLSESSTLSTVLSKSFFLEDALIDTFDGTLMSKNMAEIVSEGRDVKPGRDPSARLGKLIKRPFSKFTPEAIVRYFLYLPLNFIPVIGTVLFVILQGKRFGPHAHARYFQLKRMSAKQQEEFIEQRQAAYTAFGIPAFLLELIPVAGLFFSFTNTVAAALWAADLEQRGSTAPGLKDQAKKAS